MSSSSAANAFDLKEDARYKQGRKLINEGNFEEAIAMFSNLLQSLVNDYGQTAPETAEAYYEYGNALLTKEEENPSENLIENDGEGPPPDTVIDDDDDEGEEEQEDAEQVEDGGEREEGGANGEEGNTEDDMQIAWENLEVARLILEGEGDNVSSARKMLLSHVYMRLGDLTRLEEKSSVAIDEYTKALDIRSTQLPLSHRLLCDVHHSLACAYVDNSSLKAGNDPVAEKQKALDHYKLARESLKLRLAELQSAVEKDEEQISDVANLVDIFTETVDALQEELSSNSSATAAAAETQPVTTIGFGNNPYSMPAIPTTAFSFAPTKPAAEVKPETAEDVTTLQAKKKRKIDLITVDPKQEDKSTNKENN